MGAEMMQTFTSRKGLFFGAVLAMLGLIGPAQAALLSPGGTLFPAPAEAAPAGPVLANTGPIAFAAPGFFSGTLTTQVIQDSTNPFGAGLIQAVCFGAGIFACARLYGADVDLWVHNETRVTWMRLRCAAP